MKITRSIIPFLYLTILLSFWACGKKAPPVLSNKEFSSKVVNLRGERTREGLILKGSIRNLNEANSEVSPIKGCRLYYGQYSHKNPPCDGCPIQYIDYLEFGPEVVKEKDFLCVVPADIKGEICIFKVHLIGSGGTVGPPSNMVRVEVKESAPHSTS